jgi:hypothetical protein
MFNTKNDTSKLQSPLNNKIDEQYIRTMQADLINPGIIKIENPNQPISTFSNNNPPIYSNKSPENTVPNQQTAASSPFLNQTESLPKESVFKPTENIPTQTQESIPLKNEIGKPIMPINLNKNSILMEKTTGVDYGKEKKDSTGVKIIIVIILVLIIIALVGGGYYFWATKKIQPEIVIPEPTPITVVEVPPVEITPISEKYFLEKPNLLTVDANSFSDLDIKKIISELSLEIKQISPLKPIEFTIVDSNNNPIAFSRFLTLAKIELPKTLVSNLDESFSIYYYLDGSTIRTGLQISSKSKVATISEMKNAEKNILTKLSLFYLGEEPLSKETFKDGSYNSYAIRYNNINLTTGASFDYTVTDKYLLIGTSENTLKKIIDKIGS